MALDQKEILTKIIDTSPDIIVLKDYMGRWIKTNQRTLDIFGINEHSYEGKTDEELGHLSAGIAPFASDFESSDQKAWDEGRQIKIEEIITINGKDHIFEVIKTPVYDSLGNPDTIVVIGRDITDLLSSNQTYKSIFEHHPYGVFSLDIDGNFLDINQELQKITGYHKDELIGYHFESVIAKDNLPFIMEKFNHVKYGQTQTHEAKIVRKDGILVDLQITTIPSTLNGKLIGIHGVARDITDQKLSENVKVFQYRYLERIASGEPIQKILQGIVETVEKLSNESYCSIMLYEKEHNWLRVAYASKLPASFRERVDQFPVMSNNACCGHAAYTKKLTITSNVESDPNWEKWRSLALDHRIHSCWSMPILSTKGVLLGTFAIYHPQVRAPERYEIELLNVFSYLSGLALERNIKEQEIHYLASHDILTDLYNIRFLHDISKDIIQETKQNKTKFAILVMDLDRFKPINDSFGHAFGDKLLQQVAKRITDHVRDGDIVSRMGGDEFVLLLRDVSDKKLLFTIAERIIHEIRKPIIIENREFHVTASIGISIFPDHGNSLDLLIKNADIAMYQRKGAGGKSVALYNESMTERGIELFMLNEELRHALSKNQFELFYQPKMNAEIGKVIGFEALIRWNHPEKGLIAPSHFIPSAEESGFIEELGNWVIWEACRQVHEWKKQQDPIIPIAVNVSVNQFILTDIPAFVEKTLSEYNLPPSCLEIEITESVLNQHDQLIQNSVKRLQDLGVKISIDDFGTGYASITYLRQIRIDAIKIDRSFISSLPNNQEDAAIISALITLARELNIQIIAEGIETKEQLDFLLSKGCTDFQGYYFSQPLPAQKAHKFLSANET